MEKESSLYCVCVCACVFHRKRKGERETERERGRQEVHASDFQQDLKKGALLFLFLLLVLLFFFLLLDLLFLLLHAPLSPGSDFASPPQQGDACCQVREHPPLPTVLPTSEGCRELAELTAVATVRS